MLSPLSSSSTIPPQSVSAPTEEMKVATVTFNALPTVYSSRVGQYPSRRAVLHNLQHSTARLSWNPLLQNTFPRAETVSLLGHKHAEADVNGDRLSSSVTMRAHPANEFQGKAVGVIVVDHGSRKAESNQSLGKTRESTREAKKSSLLHVHPVAFYQTMRGISFNRVPCHWCVRRCLRGGIRRADRIQDCGTCTHGGQRPSTTGRLQVKEWQLSVFIFTSSVSCPYCPLLPMQWGLLSILFSVVSVVVSRSWLSQPLPWHSTAAWREGQSTSSCHHFSLLLEGTGKR